MSSAAPTARDPETAYAFRQLPLLAIRESKLNPRTHFDKAGLEELASSIRQLGVLTPLLVRPVGDRYEIAAGHRRYRAAKTAGLEFLPCIVRDLTDVELLEILVVENNQREDVHPFEEGAGYKALLDLGAYSVEDLAQKIGRSRIYVYDRIKLLELGKPGRELFLKGEISFAHARLISRLPVEDQAKVIGHVSDDEDGANVSGGLFEFERAAGGAEELVPKTRSVREVSEWIDENCRLDPQAENLPELFPEAAAAIDAAAEKAEKVVRITRLYQLPATARGGDPVLTERSWKRADGKKGFGLEYGGGEKKSKVCEVAVTGIIVIGPGRGETFKVCIDKDCETHWGKEQRDKAKRGKTTDDYTKKRAADEAKWKADQERREREQAAWKKAGPELLELLAEKVAAAKGLGVLGELVLDRVVDGLTASERAAVRDAAPAGKTAEALLKRAALGAIATALFSWEGPRRLPKIAKALGVDIAAVVKKHTRPAPEKKAAK